MGRLDKRAARDEDDRRRREAAERRQVTEAEQLREAERAATETAKQQNLLAEIYDLVDEFLNLMEEKDYPHLETVTLPMVTRWWWPFPRPTRKAAWKLFYNKGKDTRWCNDGYVNEWSEQSYSWWESIYLLPDEGVLWYHELPIGGGGRTEDKTISQEWDGEHAKEIAETLRACVSHLRTSYSTKYYGYWPLDIINDPYSR